MVDFKVVDVLCCYMMIGKKELGEVLYNLVFVVELMDLIN